MKKSIVDLFREAIDVQSINLNSDDRLADIPEWDSLARMVLIASLDENYGVSIESAAFEKFKTVGDLVAEVERRTAHRAN